MRAKKLEPIHSTRSKSKDLPKLGELLPIKKQKRTESVKQRKVNSVEARKENIWNESRTRSKDRRKEFDEESIISSRLKGKAAGKSLPNMKIETKKLVTKPTTISLKKLEKLKEMKKLEEYTQLRLGKTTYKRKVSITASGNSEIVQMKKLTKKLKTSKFNEVYLNEEQLKIQEEEFEKAINKQKTKIFEKIAAEKQQRRKKTEEQEEDRSFCEKLSAVIDISVYESETEQQEEQEKILKQPDNDSSPRIIISNNKLNQSRKGSKDDFLEEESFLIEPTQKISIKSLLESNPQNKVFAKRGRKKKSVEQVESVEEQIVCIRRQISEEKKQQEYIQNASLKANADTNFIFKKTKKQKQQLKKKEKFNELSIEEKYANLNIKVIKNSFDDAIETLQEYSLPSQIPCREAEKAEILQFLTEGLSHNGSSSCLYISGVPGIGKTASFLEVVKNLQEKEEYDFQFIHINAMNLSNPENIYFILAKEIAGISQCSKNQACLAMNDLFTRGKLPKKFEKYNDQVQNKNRLILLDELDYLVTKDQELLYNLMEWPHHQHSKLTIVGIANTMNLPEQLMNKIKSRMGSRRLVFNQYKHKQIQEIVKARLERIDKVFESNAIEFACKKIAISSSDIRRTLKVLRKSVELCQKEGCQLVSIPHIQQSYSELYSSPNLKAIQQLGSHHKLLLLSMALENKTRSLPISYLSECFDRYKVMANNLGKKQVLGATQITQIVAQLSSFGLIQAKEKSYGVKDIQNVTLDPNKKMYCNCVDSIITSNFQVDDITSALRDDEIYLKFQFQF